MASFYSVLQYVPEPLADERINVGVVVGDDDTTETVLLDDWRRVQAFGCSNLPSLRRALKQMEEQLRSMSKAELGELAETWRHSIQLTPPRASVLSGDALSGQVAALFLRQRESVRRPRTKTALVARTRVSLERAFAQLPEEYSRHIEGRALIAGRYASHHVDLALTNGRVLLAAQAISFARKPSPEVARDVAAAAFVVEDVSQTQDSPQMAVVIGVPDNRDRQDFSDATDLFRRMGAATIPDDRIDSWATDLARSMAV